MDAYFIFFLFAVADAEAWIEVNDQSIDKEVGHQISAARGTGNVIAKREGTTLR